MTIDINSAQKIFDKHNLGKIQKIQQEALGRTDDVLKINDKFILKIDSGGKIHKFRMERNAMMCRILKKNGILAPGIVALDTSQRIIKQKYIIMTLLEGENLIDLWKKLPVDEQRSVAIEYGMMMARIHQIKMPNFGDIIDKELQYQSWYDYIIGRHNKYFQYLEEKSLLPFRILDQVKKLFQEKDKLFRIKTIPVLLHTDFCSKNIKYYNGRLNGIFDFDESSSGHNEFDFTKIFLPYKLDGLYIKWILKGYQQVGNISDDFFQRVRLYSIGFLLNVLWFSHASNVITPALTAKYVSGLEVLLKEKLTI